MSESKNILSELVDEVLDEMTGTGAVAGYSTPGAFRGKKSNDAVAARSMPGGKVVSHGEETDDTSVNESRYSNFKNSDMMKNHAKISDGIQQAKKTLREVEFLVGICERLKSESGVDTTQLWKRTRPDIISINKQLKEISKKLYRVGK